MPKDIIENQPQDNQPDQLAPQPTDNVTTTPTIVSDKAEKVATKKKLRPLTYKQREFVSRYFKNKGNGTKTALEVYNTTDINTGATIATENIRKPEIISAMEEAYKLSGLDKQTFGKIIGKKVLNSDEKLAPKDHVKYCGIYVDTVPGVKAPTRQETTQDTTYNINLSMVRTITAEVRRSIQEALKAPITPIDIT